ncbi:MULTISPECIES: heme uptake protein IsdC [unclassified Enterococcus]|uniref:heme uptake protein IsdC n=1 Tax=unclassified Enterococcus TaxID=2608891 RepID=UPI001553387E|nr:MULTISPECIES: heme uptake protein IsdC [unclassified Enterococcus]MBS7578254.1 heme uptake protein IsdC [Enterococcus sp. MMGLQ5-2]MBS7585697.1 heme uptake protein IsdC [Enterococcus sp. MMGLQ5-1]NPD13556.1 heme uptake protein IsdC [Enterococcus sp. MMGLQ5-1]NPD38085.1 heme uptake protein IsdC [Enterococcus sp. MMGLQ5-2]
MKQFFYTILPICLILLFFGNAKRAEASLKDGTYQVNYTVLQGDGDSASMANDYFNKPAQVTVTNGGYQVSFQLNHSKWITDFQVTGSSTVNGATDTASDIRTVQFSAADIDAPISSSIKVDIDDLNYHHTYTVRLAFDTGNAMLISGSSDSASSSGIAESAAGAASMTQSTNNGQASVTNPQTATSTPLIWYALAIVFSVGGTIYFIFLNRRWGNNEK